MKVMQLWKKDRKTERQKDRMTERKEEKERTKDEWRETNEEKVSNHLFQKEMLKEKSFTIFQSNFLTRCWTPVR